MSRIEIRNLHAGYSRGIDILKGIDITIENGEVLGVIGLNGSGKSTFGKAIMNLLPLRTGQFLLDGEDISSMETKQLSRKGIALMGQGGPVFPNLTIAENLDMAFGPDPDISYVDTVCQMIPLLSGDDKALLKKRADKLSGGQRHQLALAMTLATKPSFIILDEPSAGLSPIAVESMYRLLCHVRDTMNVTIVLIEQNINRAISFCDRCILLSQGHIGKTFSGMDATEMRKNIMQELGL